MQKSVKRLPFVKMHGVGNDYIYMDNIHRENGSWLNEEHLPDLSRKVSDRHFGIGSDGLILILPSEVADFKMRIFNADGSEAQMCGNGIRSVAKYVFERGMTKKTTLKIETRAGIKIIDLFVKDGHVESIRVDMGKPVLDPALIPVEGEKTNNFFNQDINIEGKNFHVTAIGMGNPHCVIFVDELTEELVNKYGPLIETHPIFPQKTNVEFVKIVDSDHIEMRVWERGSQETLACGTGACAATVASFINGLTGLEVEVKLKGGTLKIEIDEKTNHVFMTGGAEFIAEGIYFYEVKI